MGSKILKIGFSLILLGCFALPVKAQSTSINDLIESLKGKDQSIVTVQAEVIGEVLERKDYAWINVNDGTNAIGIYLPLEWTQAIQTFGSYAAKGDIVEVTGRFNRACKEHGGDIDIHATSFKVIQKGQHTAHPIDAFKFTFAFILFSAALGLGTLYRPQFLQRKKRQANTFE